MEEGLGNSQVSPDANPDLAADDLKATAAMEAPEGDPQLSGDQPLDKEVVAAEVERQTEEKSSTEVEEMDSGLEAVMGSASDEVGVAELGVALPEELSEVEGLKPDGQSAESSCEADGSVPVVKHEDTS